MALDKSGYEEEDYDHLAPERLTLTFFESKGYPWPLQKGTGDLRKKTGYYCDPATGLESSGGMEIAPSIHRG